MLVPFLKSINNCFAVKTNSVQIYQYLIYSFGFTFLILAAFILGAGTPENLLGFLYSLLIPVYYYLLFLFVSLLALPVLWFKRFSVLILLPKILLDVMLVADYFVFGVYRFHIDMMFINMAMYDFKGIGISPVLMVITFLSVALIAAINVVIYHKRAKLPSFSLVKANLLIVLVFVAGQLIHVVGYEYKQIAITKYTPYFPYYAPLTSSSLMVKLKRKFPNIFPEKSEASSDDIASIMSKGGAKGLLQYPINPLQCQSTTESNPPNVLLFIAESWRQGDMDEEITPHIFQFSQQASNFRNHYSGGSVTVNGLFSLMFGLHPTYRDYMTASPYKNQSLLTKTLEQQGYDIDVYTTSNLDRFSLKAMMFGNIEDQHYVNPLKERVDINDRKAVDQLLTDLQKPSDKPWFKFVFLSSSHHSYYYPESHKIFTPIETNSEGFLFNKQMDSTGLFNDYKNSVHYIDSLFGAIWQAIEASKKDDNTLAIVTSDHGEEFNDNKEGYWGHGNNFTKYQTAVPMLIKHPNASSAFLNETKLTGHIDITPTILNVATNCINPTSDYSSGYNLFELPAKRSGLIISSYKDKAYLINDKVYATGLTVDSYQVDDIKLKNEKFEYSELNKLKQQETSFLKQ